MNSAKVLPFRGSHFGTRLGGTRGRLGEESDDKIVDLHGEEATELIEPQGPVDALGRFRELDSNIAIDRNDCIRTFGSCVMVVKSLEVLLELEWGIKLSGLVSGDCLID